MRRVTRPPAWSKHLGLLVALSLLLGLVAVPPAGGARAAGPPYPPAAGSATPAASPSPVASPTPTLPPGTTPTVTDVPSLTVTLSPTSSLTPTPTGTPQGPPTQTITPTPPPDPTPTPPDWAVILPGEGGVLASPDGWVRVDFPPGAVTAPAGAAFSLVETPPYASPADPFYRFDLSAWDLATGEPVTTFRESLTLTLSYSETAVAGLNEASLRLVSWDPETAGWLPLPGEVDLVENRIRAALGHFSLLGAQGDPAAVVAETFKAYQTDLFAGSAGYGFDLEAPSGPNGLAPSLPLRYNSGAVNQMKAPYSPGTWVGSGWSLDLGYVEYQEATGEYSLVLNGASHRIVYDDDTSAYHTHPESFVKVTRSAVGTRWWEVTAKDGTTYRFGRYLEEDTRYGGSYGPSVLFYQVGDAQNRCKRHLLKWYLDEVEDTHGNVLGIVYQAPQTERNLDCDHTCPECDNGYYPVEVYPYRVLYSTNASAGDGVAEYQVEFTLEERYDEGVDDHVPDGTLNYETHRLSEVSVTAATEEVASYHFTYDGTHYPLALTKVQRYGEGGSVSLPAVTFGYERTELSFRVQQGTGECETEQAYGDRPFLTSVQNGYGGELAVGYAAWGPCEPDAGGDWFSEPFRESGWGRQTVVTYTLSGGVEGSPEVSYTYGYTNGVQAGGSFVGFEEGRTSDAAGNDSTLEHYAHGWDAEHILNGKVEEARHYQGSSTLLKATVNTWETDSLWGEEPDFAWLDRVVERSCGPGGCQSKKTAYDYDPAMQGGMQYGNVTAVQEYESETAQVPTRTTRRWYNTRDDSSAYIVDRVQTEAVYEQDTSTQASKTWYYYDTYDSHQQQVGAKGELWAVQRFFQKRPDGSDWLWDAAETRYAYDAYGNQVSATAYAGKAVMRVTSSWDVSRVEGPTLPRTTTTEYDAAYHTFAVTVTRPAVGSYLPVETREYYGVNESDTDTGDGVFGQVKRVRDTKNGTDTWAQYDAFGRLTYRWLPGDTPVWEPAYASQAYGYDDTARRLYSRQRDDLGGSSPAHLESWHFYDGLGRLIQGQAESAVTNQVLVTDRAYDALGRPEKEGLPYRTDGAGTYHAPTWSTLPHTTTAYDALGRTAQVTHPDGTTVQHEYGYQSTLGLWYDRAIDENGHKRVQLTDSFGRLRRVHEWWGDQAGQYYATDYGYDVRDNLTAVWDANAHDSAGNLLSSPPYTTTMEYDLLGRKTAMSDPDMGEWSYGYDAQGNLTSQTDAKGQTIAFSYDALNRLTLKDYPSGSDAVFVYDDPGIAFGWGRLRLSYVGSQSSNGHLYAHDQRGRVITDTASVDSIAYGTLYTYDAMDRVVTMAYPDGEVITTTYDAQGLPNGMATGLDGGTYAGSATYNALGQLNLLDFGALGGAKTTYAYYGEAGAAPPPGYSNSPSFRLMEVRTVDGADQEALHMRFGYDASGNVQGWWDDHDAQPASFTYDPLNRLKAASGAYTAGYDYDPIGNMTLKAEGSLTVTMEYSDPAHVHAAKVVNGETFGYDANGNMTARKENGVTYGQSWDEENRLREVTFAGKTTLLTYGVDGSLVKKDDGMGVTTYAGAGYEVYQIPAGRDLVGDDFNDGNADGWSPTGGTWAVEKRAYSGLGNAVSLWTPTFRTGKVWAKVQTQGLGAIARNGYLVFDYRDADNYRFAGLQDDSNQWVIGERLAGTLYTRAAASETINTGQWYSLELVVSGSTATLKAGVVKKVGYTFDGIQGGKVGLLVVNAHSHFDDVVVSCQVIDDFRDGDADGWAPTGGTWQVENPFYGEYSGQDGGTQLSLWDQSMTSGRVGAAVSAQAGLELQYNGYLVFDYADASNYKYAGMDGTGQRWVIREVVSGTDTLRAGVAGTIVKGTLYDVEVQVSGNLATLKVGGVVKTSYAFDGIQGGQVGLRIAQAHTHFKEVYLRAFSQVTKYYTFGGRRIAMRRDHILFFLAADHLGTTSVVLDAAGNVVDESRHHPYGTERWPLDGTFPTEYRFTGQLLDGYSNLYLMGARQYDPQLGRWASPDTMVPDPTNPQSLSRYSYVRAAPLRYSDPSGRREEGECGFEGDPCPDSSPSPTSLSEAEIEALLDFLVQAILEEYGSVDDLEALALISDLVAIYYPNWDGYLSEMSSIFLGTDLYGPGTLIAALAAGGCGGIGREQHDCMANEHYFLDKGFHPDFQDGHNQPYHAWAYVAQTAAPGSPAAYTTGRLMGIVANTVHEPLQSRLGMVDGWGTSWQDYVLSESAMSIGLVVSAEAVTPYKLGDTMRFAFGAKGPGSSGKLQKLVGRWGRLRGMQ